MSSHPKIREGEKSFWEKKSTIRLIWISLWIGCAVSAVFGFWLAAEGKLVYKPHFEDKTGIAGILGTFADTFPVFYGVWGFLAFSFIVLAGQHLRKILMRREDYYDPVPEDEYRAPATDHGEGAQ